MLQALIDVFSKDSDFKSITAGVRAGMREQLISGLSGSSRQILMAAIHQDQQRPLLVVTHNMFSAQKIADDLQEVLSPEQVLLYPANELMAAESAISSPETLAQRIDVLVQCARGFRGVVVVPFPECVVFCLLLKRWRTPGLCCMTAGHFSLSPF